jgi:kinetochore protein Spc25
MLTAQEVWLYYVTRIEHIDMSRPPQIDLAMLLQQANPQIDLRISTYDLTTRNFIKAVVHFKSKAIALIAERRDAQAAEIKRAVEKSQLVEAETSECKSKEIELLASACSNPVRTIC